MVGWLVGLVVTVTELFCVYLFPAVSDIKKLFDSYQVHKCSSTAIPLDSERFDKRIPQYHSLVGSD